MTADVFAEASTMSEQALPAIGGGDTATRWLTLMQWARSGSVSAARLAEAHHDAVAILSEAGITKSPGMYGVWASEAPAEVLLDRESVSVSGCKRFCSGVGLVDRALVTVGDGEGGRVLVDVAVGIDERVEHDLTGWNTPALAATATGSVSFDRQPIGRIVGAPGWYLSRPGFWHGAVGPSACWAGAALGLVDEAKAMATSSTIERVVLGELTAEEHLLTALLRDVGHTADLEPDDRKMAQRHAYSVRHLVERSTQRIADAFSRGFGPRPFVNDPAIAQRLADLHLYTRQQHGLRDLESLGSLDRS